MLSRMPRRVQAGGIIALGLGLLLAPPMAAAGSVRAEATLTMAEVATHDRPADCWLVIEGVVYDVTAFIAAHPGGAEIERGCGKDATRFFRERDAAGGHSAAAEAMLPAFRVGALGESVTRAAPGAPTGPHPHDLRARGRWVGLLASVDTSPPWSLDVHIKHHLISEPGQRSRIGVVLGLGLWPGLDVQFGDVIGDGVSHLEARWQALGRSDALAVSISVGAEFFRVEDDDEAEGAPALMGDDTGAMDPTTEPDPGPPSIYLQIANEATLFDRWVAVRLNALGFVQPGFDEGLALGVGLELRPDTWYGLFAEGVVPVLDRPAGAPIWSLGARLYTVGHHFGMYIASTPTASVSPLAGRPFDGVSAGFSIARAFAL